MPTDKQRLDALRDRAWELRPYVLLGGAVGWCVIARPDGLAPLVIADTATADPRAAIDAALAALKKEMKHVQRN